MAGRRSGGGQADGRQVASRQAAPVPAAHSHVAQLQVADMQASARLAANMPAADVLAAHGQAADRQAMGRQATDRQVADRQATDRQVADRQAMDRQVADRPATAWQAAHPQAVATRRGVLRAAAALPLLALVRPAVATPDEMRAAIAAWTGGQIPASGKVTLDIARLIDNGNAVPVTIRVDSPMTPQDYVTGIALFNERNPETDIARFTLTARSGTATVSTRIRLATSQKLVAVARMSDGSCWQQAVDVIVALAACIEGEPM